MQNNATNPICPKCGAHAGIPIVYGYPDSEMLDADDAGEVVLGGCVCTFDQPEWSCRACRYRWRYPCPVTSSNPSTDRRKS
jgi:hypothetical protein